MSSYLNILAKNSIAILLKAVKSRSYKGSMICHKGSKSQHPMHDFISCKIPHNMHINHKVDKLSRSRA